MIGHLHLLWWWCLDYAPDGDLHVCTPDDLEEAMGWEGTAGALFAALIGCGGSDAPGFIEQDDTGARIHDWHEYGGKMHARRDANRLRKARSRLSQDGHADVTPMSQAREEETREEERTAHETRGERSTRADAPHARLPFARAFPDGFTLRDDDLTWVTEHGFYDAEIDPETELFVDYYRSRGDPRADWYAAWRNWMRRSRQKG